MFLKYIYNFSCHTVLRYLYYWAWDALFISLLLRNSFCPFRSQLKCHLLLQPPHTQLHTIKIHVHFLYCMCHVFYIYLCLKLYYFRCRYIFTYTQIISLIRFHESTDTNSLILCYIPDIRSSAWNSEINIWRMNLGPAV